MPTVNTDNFSNKPASKGTNYITSVQLTKLAGASYRQVDYWVRIGIIPTIGESNPGSGYQRHHDLGVVDRVKCLVRVSKALGKNPSPGILRTVYEQYDNGFVDLGQGVVLRWGL